MFFIDRYIIINCKMCPSEFKTYMSRFVHNNYCFLAFNIFMLHSLRPTCVSLYQYLFHLFTKILYHIKIAADPHFNLPYIRYFIFIMPTNTSTYIVARAILFTLKVIQFNSEKSNCCFVSIYLHKLCNHIMSALSMFIKTICVQCNTLAPSVYYYKILSISEITLRRPQTI